MYVYMPGAPRGQKRTLAPLKLELQMVVNCMWMLGIGPASSGKAASVAFLTTNPPLQILLILLFEHQLLQSLGFFIYLFKMSSLDRPISPLRMNQIQSALALSVPESAW